MIKAVFFDVGNTLVYPYPSVGAVMSRVLSRHGHDVSGEYIDSHMIHFYDFYAKLYEQDNGLWSEDDRQRAMWIDGYSLLCRRVGVTEGVSAIAEDIYTEFDLPQCWALFDGVRETFEALKADGYKVGLISNWGRGLGALMNGLGIGTLIDSVVASAEVGMHKPEPHIFHHALKELDVCATEAIHVGDHVVADVEGAASVGIIPLLIVHTVRDNYDPTATAHTPDVVTISTVAEVVDLLRAGTFAR